MGIAVGTKRVRAVSPLGGFYQGTDGAKKLLNLNVTLVNPLRSSEVSLNAAAANLSCCTKS